MAENPIDKNSLFDFDGTKKGVEDIIRVLKDLANVIDVDLKKSAEEWVKSLQGVNINTKEGQETITKASTAAKELGGQQRELIKIEKELSDAKIKLGTLERDSVQTKVKETAEIKKSIAEKKKEITQGKAAADSYAAMTRRLKDMRDAWRMAGEEGRKNLSPQIQKLNQELKNLDATIGNHQRNVGNYKSALAGMGRQLLSAAGLVGGMSLAVKGFRAILDSTQATGDAFRAFIGGLGEGARYFAQRIATLDFSNLLSGLRDAYREGKRYADQLDLIGDLQRSLGLQVIDIDTEIARQRIIAKDRRQDLKTREAAVDEIIKLEKKKLDETQRLADMSLDNEIENIQTRVDINKDAIVDFITNHKDYVDQINKGADIEKRLKRDAVVTSKELVFNAKTEQMMEMETRKFSQAKYNELFENMSEEERSLIKISQLNNLVIDDQRDRLVAAVAASKTAVREQITGEETLVLIRNRLYNELIREEKNLTTEVNKEQEERMRSATAALEAKSKAQQKSMVDQAKNANAEIVADASQTQQKLGEIRLAEVEDHKDAEQVRADFSKEMNREILRDRIASAQGAIESLQSATNALTDIFIAQKQRELNAAGDNAEKREEIERKYFRREQSLAIASAIINGALAITKVQAQTGVLSPLAIPLIIASTLGQIAVIASQKFAEGGFTGKGSFRDDTGERVAGIVHEDEFVIDKKQTRRYRPLLDAIHRNDTEAIAVNTIHHEVWGRANDAIDFRQDPYTQKMYELMKSQPIMYSDSNGDLVLRWNGRVQVIKRN